MAEQAAPYMCVWYGTPEECQNCGGWTKAEGEDGVRGPFPGDKRYCSEDCYAEALIFAERARLERETGWCPACGYDRHEHAPGCQGQVAPSCSDVARDPTGPSAQAIGPETA